MEKIINNKELLAEFWKNVADQCFGCGACSTVCPLCFCTKQEFSSDLAGCPQQCLKWDSCFAKRFSEIQLHHDFRPENTDRLYNWYHHKFVRAPFQNGQSLCVGCGRCIEACPAHLNIKTILHALKIKSEQKNEKH